MMTNTTMKIFFAALALYASSASAWSSETCKTKMEAKANTLETFSLIQHTLCKEGEAVVDAIVQSDQPYAKQQSKSPMKSLWDLHAKHVQTHLDASDKFLYPKLGNAFGFQQQKAAKVVQQSHKRINTQINDITDSLTKLEKSKDESSYQQSFQNTKEKLQQYQKSLVEESKIRSDCIVPPAQNTISKEEWSDLMKDYIAEGGVDLGSFIYFMTENKFRNEYLKAKGSPGFVWHVAFKSPFNKFQKRFSSQLKELEA